TVYATGQRVVNRTLSVGPASACPLPAPGSAGTWPEGCEPLETWFEAARDKGRATGIVTTTFVTDATPAAFVGHSPSRHWVYVLWIYAETLLARRDVRAGGRFRPLCAVRRSRPGYIRFHPCR